jgi:hypothetical protein
MLVAVVVVNLIQVEPLTVAEQVGQAVAGKVAVILRQ